MMMRTAAYLTLIAGAPALARQAPVEATISPAALQLFERDWVLMNWALKYYDSDHDALLQPSEAEAAAEAFRRIADTNHDGRVTPQEYRSARQLILSQY